LSAVPKPLAVGGKDKATNRVAKIGVWKPEAIHPYQQACRSPPSQSSLMQIESVAALIDVLGRAASPPDASSFGRHRIERDKPSLTRLAHVA